MSSSPNNNDNSSGNNATTCVCSHLYNGTAPPTAEMGILKTPAISSVNANILADTLGVSPMYRQQDSARWQSAHHVYQSSRAHSPVRTGGGSTPIQFAYTAAGINGNNNGSGTANSNTEGNAPTFDCVTPHQLHQIYYQQTSSAVGSPISLEDIAFVNRRRHQEVGDMRVHESKAGALELEAVAAVHELACSVKSIFVSEILPRTADLIFVNIKTHEVLGRNDQHDNNQLAAQVDSDTRVNVCQNSLFEPPSACRHMARFCHIKTQLQAVVHLRAVPRHRAAVMECRDEMLQFALYRRAWRQFSSLARFTSRAISLKVCFVHFHYDDGPHTSTRVTSFDPATSLSSVPPSDAMRILNLDSKKGK